MKPVIVLFHSLFWVYGATLSAQNNVLPQVIINDFVEYASLEIPEYDIYYDIVDPDTDLFEVSLLVYNEIGEEIALSNVHNLTGDFGPVVGTGAKFVHFTSTLSIFRIAVIVKDSNAPSITELINMVSAENLEANLSFLTGIRHRDTGPIHLQETKDWLLQRMFNYGYEVSLDNFVNSNYDALNIIADGSCAADDGTVYIVDAHYDTVEEAPGADDNGSGVAGFVEIARILSERCFVNGVRFIGFDMEEDGLIGSIHYVNQYLDTLQKIGGVFNFEMIGYYTEAQNTQEFPIGFDLLYPLQTEWLAQNNYAGNFITIIGDESSVVLNAKFDSCIQVYVPDLKVVSLIAPPLSALTADFYRSDHAAFMFAHYPALFITDSANFRNAHYHTSGDVLSTISFPFMANVTKATLATLCEMAGYIPGSFGTSLVTTHIVSGIAAINPSDKIKVYPTILSALSSALLTIETGDAYRCVLYDTEGRLVSKSENAAPDMSGLQMGIYYLKIETHTYKQNYKIVWQ